MSPPLVLAQISGSFHTVHLDGQSRSGHSVES